MYCWTMAASWGPSEARRIFGFLDGSRQGSEPETTGAKQPLVIREGEWAELQRRVTALTTSVRDDARRARLVLVAMAGASLESVAERVACFKGI